MRKANRRSKIYVGAFAVIGLVVFVAVVLLTGNNTSIYKGRTQFFASFQNTAGLHVGAPLRMGGVDIGTVDKISISANPGTPQVLAALTVYSPYDKLVRVDSEISLETQGVLGDKFLLLNPGSQQMGTMAPDSIVKTKERTEIAALMTRSTEIVDTVRHTAEKIEKFTDSLPPPEEMQKIVKNLANSTQAIHEILKSLNAPGSIVHKVGNDSEYSQRVENILIKLETASVHFASVAQKVDQGQGTLGALVNDPSLYDDMRALMGRANRSKVARYMIQQTLKENDEGKKVN